MAFGWNPKSKKTNNSNNQYPQSGNQNVSQRNQNYSTFKSVNDDIERIVAARSIINSRMVEQPELANPFWQTLGVDSDILAMPIASNKTDRITQYRKISKFPECDWCLDEICDEFVHDDDKGNFINLTLPENKSNLNETRKEIIQEEFKRFMNLFRFRDDGYNLIKRFLIEGELAWENVIKSSVPELGIVGVRYLPTEYYETLLDTRTNTPIGIIFDVTRYAADTRQMIANNILGASQVFNQFIPTTATYSYDIDKCIPLLWSQVTYIRSHESAFEGDKYVAYPIIEKAKQAYYQLSLLQDAAVILRVTRAPERLLFNISTGKMNDSFAKQYVRDFANGLKAKKTLMPKGPTGGTSGADIGSVYNPVSMLESYIFGKSDGNDGTSIESVGSSASYDELADIKYFLRRFMKQFKVPFSRYETPENTPPAPDQLSYEEHSFMRMIVRFQRQFADGFKKSFIVDLKLRDMWDKYELKEEDIDIQFVKPSLCDIYEIQQLVETKMKIYSDAVGTDDEFSRTLAMKKYLGFTDADIKENYENLIKEAMLKELSEYYKGQIAEHKGLAGWEPPIKFKDQEDKEQKELEGKANEEGNDESSEEAADEENAGNEEGVEAAATGEESGNEEEGSKEEEENEQPAAFGLQ